MSLNNPLTFNADYLCIQRRSLPHRSSFEADIDRLCVNPDMDGAVKTRVVLDFKSKMQHKTSLTHQVLHLYAR